MSDVTLIPLERTGNNMFQLAAAYTLCKRTKNTLYVDWGHCPTMKALIDAIGADIKYKKAEGLMCDCRALSYTPLPNPKGRYSSIRGWFQDPRFFMPEATAIRKLFNPLVGERVPGRIGVHIRLGDYLSDHYKKDYFTLKASDIVKSMKLLGNPEGEVVLFTDSLEEASNRMPFENYSVDTSDDPISVLKAMSSCEYFIASNSTLSWWACWLGKIPYVAVHYPWTKFHPQDSLYEVNWAIYKDQPETTH